MNRREVLAGTVGALTAAAGCVSNTQNNELAAVSTSESQCEGEVDFDDPTELLIQPEEMPSWEVVHTESSGRRAGVEHQRSNDRYDKTEEMSVTVVGFDCESGAKTQLDEWLPEPPHPEVSIPDEAYSISAGNGRGTILVRYSNVVAKIEAECHGGCTYEQPAGDYAMALVNAWGGDA